MTTVNTNATVNPYATTSTQNSFANDIYGSKLFGQNQTNMTQSQNPVYINPNPENAAQAILQQYLINNGGAQYGQGPTAQDYYMATQIASMFSAQNQLPPMSSSFARNDIFAQSLFS